MTVTAFTIPLATGVKRNVTKVAGIATTEFITTIVPANNVGIVMDDALIDLATIHSGLLVPALEELGDFVLEKSASVSVVDVTAALAFRVKHLTPKLGKATLGMAAPDATAISVAIASGYDICLIINKPVVTKRTTGLSHDAANYLAEYIRESLH